MRGWHATLGPVSSPHRAIHDHSPSVPSRDAINVASPVARETVVEA